MQNHFNHYYLTEQVGSKPLRSAYLAHPVNDVSQKVLLKIFDATCLALGQESERLLYQVEWIKQLRHAHVVPIVDLGVEQGLPYVATEYLSGGSLRHRLESFSPGRLSLEEALKIIFQVGQALSYFHGSAHLHQNIKPENIFFNEREEALLTDFRLSGFIDVAILDYQSDPRNMCYMAPEQFVGSASEKSDQYALACLAYELIAGQVPFFAQSFAMMWASHYSQFPTPLSDVVPDLPKRIGKAVFKAMAKDPSERYADIAAFLLALEGTALSSVPAITRPLALSILDPFSADVAEPRKDVKRDKPVAKSLTGIPSDGSLATAPFGTSLAGAAFGTSLEGAAFGTSLAGVAFGMSLPGNPFTASLSGMALATSQEGGVLEKEEERNPFETSLAGSPFETSLAGNVFETSLAGNVFETSQEGGVLEKEEEGSPFETSLAGNSFETSLAGNPFETSLAGSPFETSLAGNVFETSQEGGVLEREEERNPFEAGLAGNVFETSQQDNILEKALRENPFEMNLAGNAFETSLAGNMFETSQEEDFLEKVLGENPFEIGLIDTPLTTHLLERWERASSEPYANTNTGTSVEGMRSDPFSMGYLWRNTKYSIPAFWSGHPRKPAVATGLLMQLRGYLGSVLGTVRTRSRRVLALLSELSARLLELWQRVSSEHRAKRVTGGDGLAGDTPIKPFSVGRIFKRRRDSIPLVLFGQRRELPTPALWFVLVLSIIVLIGSMVFYSFLTIQSSGQLKSVNLHNRHQKAKNVNNVPIDGQLIAQPVAHFTGMSAPQQNGPSVLSEALSETSLIGGYAEQSQTYNLSYEGRLDWIDWGLHMPGDVNRRSGVQQQISTFGVISNGFNMGIVQRTAYNANARLWWSDGTPVMVAQPQQASGVYVRGIDEGFSFSVPASVITRTLRVYVAVNGVQGKFTASLNGRTYVDESLSSAYDPNGPQVNGISTLVFNGTMPNQVLTVTYTAMTTNGINGYVLLRAASLH